MYVRSDTRRQDQERTHPRDKESATGFQKDHGETIGTGICDPSGRNQSHVGRVRFPLRAKMHGRAHITDSCFIAFITYKIC